MSVTGQLNTTPFAMDRFWEDFEELTGLKVPEGDRYSFFTCSC